MTKILHPNDEKGWEMVRERIQDMVGEQCEVCGGQVATDMTPKWVFRDFDICDCIRCPECGKIDPKDERIQEHMKCGRCNYL